MYFMRHIVIGFACLVPIAANESQAQQMPAGLREKSIGLSWTDTRTIKDTSGRVQSIAQSSTIDLYVSSLGRVFSSFQRSTSGSSSRGSYHQASVSKQISGTGDNFLHWRFENGTLVADQLFIRGARRITIIFGGRFDSCSVNVLHGKEAGTTPIYYRGTDSRIEYEIIDIKVTSTSCSIRQGNVFGN
jgi:hypothetical protein